MNAARRNSFTLIELLVVMAVIAMLSAITLGAAGAIQNKAARSRAAAEIAAISVALESYKTDNGAYPSLTTASMPTATSSYNATTYKNGATNLYFSLAGGQPNWVKSTTLTGPIYMSFKKNQLDSTVSCGVQDPFGYFYGYSGNNAIMNVGFFDLWSTAGKTDSSTSSLAIRVNNWSSN